MYLFGFVYAYIEIVTFGLISVFKIDFNEIHLNREIL